MKEHQRHPATPRVAVCGAHDCTPAEYAVARWVGQLLAERGAVVLCGGGTGVMAAVTEGAWAGGGPVIGIRPNDTRAGAHPDLSAVLLTGLGEARNAVLVRSADAVIAVGGSWGTLSEIAFACHRGDIPVISLTGWQILDTTGHPVPGITAATTPEEAVTLALPVDLPEPLDDLIRQLTQRRTGRAVTTPARNLDGISREDTPASA